VVLVACFVYLSVVQRYAAAQPPVTVRGRLDSRREMWLDEALSLADGIVDVSKKISS
jgi:hypothetical protein